MLDLRGSNTASRTHNRVPGLNFFPAREGWDHVVLIAWVQEVPVLLTVVIRRMILTLQERRPKPINGGLSQTSCHTIAAMLSPGSRWQDGANYQVLLWRRSCPWPSAYSAKACELVQMQAPSASASVTFGRGIFTLSIAMLLIDRLWWAHPTKNPTVLLP